MTLAEFESNYSQGLFLKETVFFEFLKIFALHPKGHSELSTCWNLLETELILVFSDKPITDQQNFYKEVMYELMMLRKELETEQGMRQMLESKVKELEVKTPSRNDTLKSPPIRLEIEAVPKGNYISALGEFKVCFM